LECARLRLTWQSRPNRRYLTPNLARNSASDEKLLGQNVLRNWITHLLTNLDYLPDQLMVDLEIPSEFVLPFAGPPLTAWLRQRLQALSWLQQFDAYQLYRLGLKGWRHVLQGKGKAEEALLAWEESRGDSLLIGDEVLSGDDLYWWLLGLVLPRITQLELGPNDKMYAKPPAPSWRRTLETCRNYIDSPILWGIFVQHTRGIEECLYYGSYGENHLNSRFRERLDAFSEDDLLTLMAAFKKFSRTGGKTRAELTPEEAVVFHRAVREIGDLKIAGREGSWRIDSFKLPKS